MVNRAAFDSAESFAMKSDILRYELLLRYGGLYCDLDFECLRSIKPLLAQVGEETFGGSVVHTYLRPFTVQRPPRRTARCIVPAPRRRDPARERPLHQAERHVRRHETIARATGPAFLTRLAAECPAVTIFPQPVLYPRPGETAAAYARHHFWGSWRGKGERQITGETIS